MNKRTLRIWENIINWVV